MLKWLQKRMLKREAKKLLHGTLEYIKEITLSIGDIFDNVAMFYKSATILDEWEPAIDDLVNTVVEHKDDIQKIVAGVKGLMEGLQNLGQKDSIVALTAKLTELNENTETVQEATILVAKSAVNNYNQLLENVTKTIMEAVHEEDNDPNPGSQTLYN